MPQAAEVSQSPIDLVGGVEAVHRLAAVFYDLVEADPAYAELRAMHAPDLDPLRESLGGFLVGWLGGPSDWSQKHPGVCMMSLHAPMPITPASAGQWIAAMNAAMTKVGFERTIGDALMQRFCLMADAMIQR